MVSGVVILPLQQYSDQTVRPKYLYTDDGQGNLTQHPDLVRYQGSTEMTKGGTDYMAVAIQVSDQAAYNTLTTQSDVFEIDGQAISSALNATDTFPVNLTPEEWALVMSRVLAVLNIEG